MPALELLVCAGLALSACGSHDDATEPPAQPVALTPAAGSGGDGARIETLDSVDVSRLEASDRRRWVSLITDLLSPCGQPISVARCAATPGSCGRCVPAARYLARLANEGYDTTEIRELYRLRYAEDTHLEFSLEGAPSRGEPMAAVTMVEFSDFQCPYCGAAEPVLAPVLRQFEGRVRLVFKNYPLSGHEHAMEAARASFAADNQGKFWEMHDMLFERQTALEDADIDRYAAELGLDMDRFHTDIASSEVQARIDADKAEGHRVGVDSTPTLFIQGRRFEEPLEALSTYLREELDQ
jgi:glutaredoxin